MAKKNNISTINLSLILIILICAIIFFLYLKKKEKFHNMHDMLDMEPSDIRMKLQNVKRCIENPESCNQKERDEIVEQLESLINLSEMI